MTTLAGSIAFWAYLGRHLWFFGDEWQFLLGRGLRYAPGDPRSIWYPHFEHWSTLPVLLWRALYSAFHLSTYWPYLLALLVVEAAVMHLVWRVCLRNGATPWVATAAVAVLGLLGPGAEDLGWAFQVGFDGSVAFGLVAVLLLDRPAPSARHCAGGSVFLLCSLMCSTVGDAMAIAVALVLLARGPWPKVAAVLALPVGSYALWWAALGRSGLQLPSDRVQASTVTGVAAFIWTGLSTALGRVFNLDAAGGALLVGLLAWVAWRAPGLARQRPALVGLCAASLSFYAITALGRDALGDAGATAPRYTYVALALLLPLICALLGSPRRHVTGMAPPGRSGGRPQTVATLTAIAFLVATAAGDAGQAVSWAASRTALVDGIKAQVTATSALLASGYGDAAGGQAAPIPYAPDLKVAVLARLGRSHAFGPGRLPPVEVTNARALLALTVTSGPRAGFPGHFLLAGADGAVGFPAPPGCLTFGPTGGGPEAQVSLRSQGKAAASSVRVAVATSPGLTATVAALLVPPGGPASDVPVELGLASPPAPMSYLDDDDARAGLELRWASTATLTLCGLAPASVGGAGAYVSTAAGQGSAPA